MFNRIKVYSGSNREAGKSLSARRMWFDATGASTTSPVIQGDAIEHNVSSVPAIAPDKLPEDVVKATPAYKAVLSESIQRRQEIAALKEQIAKLQPPAPDASAQTQAQTAKPALTLDEVDELVNKKLSAVQLKVAQETLLSQYKVPAESREIWRDSNLEVMTQRLQAAYGTPQGSGSAGNGVGNTDANADLKLRIKNALTGQGDSAGTNLYTPEAMTRLGGGVVG